MRFPGRAEGFHGTVFVAIDILIRASLPGQKALDSAVDRAYTKTRRILKPWAVTCLPSCLTADGVPRRATFQP